MTPKEAFEYIYGHSNCYCVLCKQAFKVLETLVEGPTVAEVRAETKRLLIEYARDHEFVVTEALTKVIDFIDRKEG